MPHPKIYNAKEPLDLTRLKLSKPTNRNGSHFIKMMDIENPIYVLSPKCLVKQGFVKSGKKMFCDFVFSNEDTDFLSWLEDLEETSRNRIYENRSTWFETPLDEHDIESSMSPPYKAYKSGKFFIVRANVPLVLDKINIKIYDETEKETGPENVQENTKVIAVLEFQGIRCNVRSFQFEIELKQLLIIEPEKLFEQCIFRTVQSNPGTDRSKPETNQETNMIPIPTTVVAPSVPVIDAEPPTENDSDVTINTNTAVHLSSVESGNLDQMESPNMDETRDVDVDPHPPLLSSREEENLEKTQEEPTNAIEIIDTDFDLEAFADANTQKEPVLRLKSRNDVYYRLYKEMRQRAKEAKREALANYLEAKRIKNTYLLEDVSSDSEEDDLEAEIEKSA